MVRKSFEGKESKLKVIFTKSNTASTTFLGSSPIGYNEPSLPLGSEPKGDNVP